MRLALASLLLSLLPTLAHAEIPWRGDFESGDVSQWNEQVGPVAERVGIVEDPVREGTYAARVEIRPGDLGIGNLNRVELGYHPPADTFEGSERWYAWSVMQDAAYPLGASWHAFTYWEATQISTAALSFRLYAGNQINFATFPGGEAVHWESTFEPGTWHDFVLHVVWSGDAAEGLVELWYDGEQVVPPTSVATMFTLGDGTAPANFLHIGMIRDDQLAVDEVFFYDGVIEATSPDDLMPSTGESSGGGSESDDGPADSSAGEGASTVDDDGTASSTNGSGSSPTTTASSAGESGSGGDGGTSGAADEGDGGCGCTSGGPGAWAGLAALFGLLRRRRPARWAR